MSIGYYLVVSIILPTFVTQETVRDRCFGARRLLLPAWCYYCGTTLIIWAFSASIITIFVKDFHC